jgi:hypothetical protein
MHVTGEHASAVVNKCAIKSHLNDGITVFGGSLTVNKTSIASVGGHVIKGGFAADIKLSRCTFITSVNGIRVSDSKFQADRVSVQRIERDGWVFENCSEITLIICLSKKLRWSCFVGDRYLLSARWGQLRKGRVCVKEGGRIYLSNTVDIGEIERDGDGQVVRSYDD